jgi:hypothetical protein
MVNSEDDVVSTFKTKAPKSIEMTKLFKSDDELTAGSFDDLEDVGSKESIVDLTNLVDSEDDSSDDESLSFESDCGLLVKRMHRRHLTNHAYVRFPKTPLGLSVDEVELCIKATEQLPKVHGDCCG